MSQIQEEVLKAETQLAEATNAQASSVETLKKHLTLIENEIRLVSNNLNLLSDITIKGNDAEAVAELKQWMKTIHIKMLEQKEALVAKLPKEEAQSTEAETV